MRILEGMFYVGSPSKHLYIEEYEIGIINQIRVEDKHIFIVPTFKSEAEWALDSSFQERCSFFDTYEELAKYCAIKGIDINLKL
jgi:hypothetical protein